MRRVSLRTYCHCGPQKEKEKKKTETANNDHQKTEERH
jgi:hypothetical protein